MSNLSTETEGLDRHTPPDFAAWLRKRAEENRRVAELPPSKWPQRPELLKHLAFRFEQGAEIVEQMIETERQWDMLSLVALSEENKRLRADLESLKRYTGVYSSGWRSPFARPADDVTGDPK